ncbi:hypothetical protein A2U01_0043492 [Trifolium medium]|uniref:Uncharacterized protein n=1 Tax=Trifolium medium TaxID=97028 RepID=A0A392QFK2_9FABA|nr:hypothetical protein [Trifolium medium]
MCPITSAKIKLLISLRQVSNKCKVKSIEHVEYALKSQLQGSQKNSGYMWSAALGAGVIALGTILVHIPGITASGCAGRGAGRRHA